jgi:hypothetical protein
MAASEEVTVPDLPQRLRAAAETQPALPDWLARLPARPTWPPSCAP